MKPRTPLVAANWKMNPPPKGWNDDDSPFRSRAKVEVAVFPTFLDLTWAIDASLVTGAQCGRAEPSGAFTGDVPMQMLKNLGCTYVLCGHSERRKFHGETDSDVAAQADAALNLGLIPIVCIGETAEERSAGKAEEVIRRQLQKILPLLNTTVIIAYEPVWAIGTGKNTLPADAQRMHAFIRSLLQEESRAVMRILYGGSVKPENAKDLIAEPDIDGFLVGGASLDPDSFASIVASCQSQ